MIGRLGAASTLALLLVALPARAEEQAPVPVDALVAAMLQTGQVDEADAVVNSLLRDDPSNTELLFLSGLVAVQRTDYRRAIEVFRRILIDHPNAERVRLELARAFFSVGDYGNALRQFQFARVGNPPPEVQANIDRYLLAIRQAKSLSYSIDVALAPDSNVNVGSSSREITLYGLPFELTDDARGKSGVGLNLSASAEWAPHIAPATRLRIGASVQRRDYSGSRFDDTTLAAYAGPRLVSKRFDLSLLGTASKRWYGGDPYATAIGGRVTATYYATPELGLTTDIVAQALHYDRESYLSGTVLAVSESAFHALSPSSAVIARAGVSRQTARLKAYSNWGGYIGGGYARDLPAGFSAAADVTLSLASYDAQLPVFGTRRVDHTMTTTASLLNRHIVAWGMTPRISYSFTRQLSTIALYSYDRNRVEIGLTKSF